MIMKKIIFTCALILSITVLVGCSKDDDGPSGSPSTKGSAKVDGKSLELKYGYAYYGDSYTEYFFYDKDVMEYIDKDIEELDIELSALWLDYYPSRSEIKALALEYKINDYKETGTYYEYEGDKDIEDYVSFSQKNSYVSCSSKSIPLEGYSYSDRHIGSFDASFSVEGKVLDISDYVVDDYSTRAIEVQEISDPDQLSFLRSLKRDHQKTSNK